VEKKILLGGTVWEQRTMIKETPLKFDLILFYFILLRVKKKLIKNQIGIYKWKILIRDDNWGQTVGIIITFLKKSRKKKNAL